MDNRVNIISSDLEENTPLPQYLDKNNYLSEFEGEEETVRLNLNVLSCEEVLNKIDTVDSRIDTAIQKAFEKYFDEDNPLISEATARDIVKTALLSYVSKESQKDFLKPANLYTDTKFTNHLKAEDPHGIMHKVDDALANYVTSDDYSKELGSIQNLLTDLSNTCFKKGGSFTKPVIGVDPLIDSHLTTKRYVDRTLYKHLVDVDPHGFIAILNNRLASYAKTKDVYSQTQTYSRAQLDSIIRELVNDAAKEAILDHAEEIDPHNVLSEVRKEYYIKLDGSVPFRSTLKGVDAVAPQDLVTLKQLDEVKQTLQKNLDQKQCEWITSGPAEATVGNVSIDTDLPETMSVQEILDAIFYGKGISLHVPEYNNIATECPIKVCIHGSTGLILSAELYKGDTLIHTFTNEDFEDDRCVTVMSAPIVEDTDFTFKVTYLNGSQHEETKTVKCSKPIFIGLLPKWQFGNTITYLDLLEFADLDKINNKFYHEGGDEIIITHKYNFTDKSLMHLMAVVPESYPDLYQMRIPSQQFEKEAFDIIDAIPFLIPGVSKDIVYKMYIYSQALYTANLETTFKFKNYE